MTPCRLWRLIWRRLRPPPVPVKLHLVTDDPPDDDIVRRVRHWYAG